MNGEASKSGVFLFRLICLFLTFDKRSYINLLIMKTIGFLLAASLLMSFSGTVHAQYGKAPASKLSEALAQKQVTHSLNVWELEALKSDNKFVVFCEAVQYSSSNKPDVLKGIRLTFLSENGNSDNNLAKTAKVLEVFIDQSEYSELMVALNQMLAEFKKIEKTSQKCEMSYLTSGGIKFGFVQTPKKVAATIGLQYSEAEVVAEFAGIEKFLTEMKEYIDIATKDLYLPENIEKLKKVKKTNQEAKDVIIDDI
ncbi:MAG TPA: hypothetical protein DCQ26_13495 [Marinilabiliales bacterium]|jgi:hypothetical protein|nr:MAG: hypothetical protein A2W95_16895 [Bacteroidetes bacterium GWA2_40_14]OFZ26383.1 MAG: hypothetical protein A2437_03520 [Bacteroidetes bacterium RIFOXYC2_FULL_40_12]HAM99617.1 hypothetical protein [Marinilabiliales bacterium]HBY53803.1 hypothetical protein [Marinilabiliales bacterium]